MKKIYNTNTTRKLTAYSAMAAALTITASEADAQVVYNDIDDVSLEAAETYDLFSLDMDDNGVVDFVFRAGLLNSGTWRFASILGMYSSLSAGNVNNQVLGYYSSYPYASALGPDFEIGPKDDFLAYSSQSNYAILGSSAHDIVYGQFGDEGDKFIGVQFDISGDTHYGWIRVNETLGVPTTLEIKDYAYQASADVPILTGDTVGSPIAINTLPESIKTVYSYGNAIYINLQNEAEMQVNVLNTTGQKVYAGIINAINNEITLNNVPAGNYLVQLINDNGVYSKSVNINQ